MNQKWQTWFCILCFGLSIMTHFGLWRALESKTQAQAHALEQVSVASPVRPFIGNVDVLQSRRTGSQKKTKSRPQVVLAQQELAGASDLNPMNSMEVGDLYQEYRPNPHYPDWALEQNLEGSLQVEMATDEWGFVSEIQLIKSSGYEILDQEALKTLKNWRLKPTIRVVVPIHFQLPFDTFE